jgi:acetyl esterase/lipase
MTRRTILKTLATIPAAALLRGQSCPVPPPPVTDHLVIGPTQPYGTGAMRHFEMAYWSTFNPSACPIAVYVHGGGWIGDAGIGGWSALITPLAQAGFTVYFPHYSLAPAARWPVPESDIKAFLDYLSANGIGDASRISLVGWSAGAHLALMTGLSDAPTYDTSSQCARNPYAIRCLVGCSSPTDLYTLFETSQPITGANAQVSIQDLLGYSTLANKAGALAASPVGIIGGTNTSVPPTLLIAGDADILVPDSQSAELVAAAGALGIGIQLNVLHGLGHPLDLQTVGGQSVALVVGWLNQFGK